MKEGEDALTGRITEAEYGRSSLVEFGLEHTLRLLLWTLTSLQGSCLLPSLGLAGLLDSCPSQEL